MTHTTKHTPGLWFTTSEMQGVGGVKVYGVETRDRCPIANCGTGKLGMENAHLIAAAPAMYEALKFLTSEIDLSKLNVRKDFSLMNAHARAVKVILQAEGKLL